MFRITVEKIEEFEYEGQAWVKTADSGNPKDGGALYEYVPSKVKRLDATKILEQTVETLDVIGVIKAVNGIA